MTEMIENKTFDEIQIGDAASLTRVLRPEDVETWAAVTGNVNLIDLDPTPVDSSMSRHGAGQASWAAALCKMADRGPIRGGLVDGPLAFDNAIDEEAAKTKGILSCVAGKADILVVPTWRPATCWPSS